MNNTLLIILVVGIILYFIMGQFKNIMYENFMPHDANYYLDSCKKFTQEKIMIDNLSSQYCNPEPINTSTNQFENPLLNQSSPTFSAAFESGPVSGTVNLVTQLENDRASINKLGNCYNETGRKQMIDREKINWCSRLTKEEQDMIENEVKKTFDMSSVYEGPYRHSQSVNLDTKEVYESNNIMNEFTSLLNVSANDANTLLAPF